jgi:hypothetical protein
MNSGQGAPSEERHTKISQVKALPPEVVTVSPARRGFPLLPPVEGPTTVAFEAGMKPGNRKGTTLAHRTAPDEPDAPPSCSKGPRAYSAARQRTVVPRSGLRGRRFKS